MDEQNLGAVNAIRITYAQVDEGEKEGEYYLTLQWTAALAGIEPETYWVWLICNGQSIDSQNVKDCEVKLKYTGLNPKECYYAVVSDNEKNFDTKKCPPVLLLFQSVTDLVCVYDGQRVSLRWKRPEQQISFTSLYARGERSAVSSSRCHGQLELEAEDLSDSDKAPGCFQVEAKLFMNDISAGPVRVSGCLYVRPAHLTSVTARQEENGEITLQAIFTHPYNQQEEMMARLVLVDGEGTDLICQEPQLLENGKSSYTLSYRVSGNYDLQDCWVRVDLCGRGSVSRLPAPWVDQVPLARPQITQSWVGPDALELKWKYPSGIHAGFGLQFGQELVSKGAVRSARLSLKKAGDLDQAVELWAASPDGGCIAPHTIYNPFVPGVYPGTDGEAKLCVGSYSETALEVALPDGSFAETLTSGISSGVLEIAAKTPLVLNVSTADVLTSEQWKTFRTALLNAGVTPEGYYFICRQVARTARMSADTQLKCLCGVNAEHRQVDLTPGMVLVVSAAAYQLQPDENAGLTEGFVNGARVCYPISLEQMDGRPVLSMDELMHTVQFRWTSGEVPQDHPNLRLWAGTADFFRQDVRAAFGRICYPQRYLDAEQLPTRYPSDSALILLSDRMGTLDQAAYDLYADPTVEIATPYLQCVGRGFWGICQSIWVQGSERLLSVGSTLGALLLQYGIDNPARMARQGTLRMWRMTPFGQMPVHLAWFDEARAKSLLLLGGDKIEVF